jgi:solute carrier family 35 protein C2
MMNLVSLRCIHKFLISFQYIFGATHYHFPCPLLMTSIHFLCQWAFAVIACMIAPIYFGSHRVQNMSWYEWFSVSAPCGIVTSGDVGLSNLSLVRITITFYTMVKASTPIFVLIWAYLFGIERITLPLLGVVLVIAMGEYLTVVGEVEFDRIGFFLCLTASMLSGARWTLVQLKLRNLDPPLKTTIATMRLLSPSMFASLFIFSLLIERPWIRLAYENVRQISSMIGLGLLGANLAIAMILCEFYLIMRANAFVLMIGGVVKEMLSILIGVTYFEDKLNPTNVSGCFVVFLGVVLYKILHYTEAQEEKRNEMFQMVDTEDNNTEDLIELRDDSSGRSHLTQASPPTRVKYEKLGRDVLADNSELQYKDAADHPDNLLLGNGSNHLSPSYGIELRRHVGRHASG